MPNLWGIVHKGVEDPDEHHEVANTAGGGGGNVPSGDGDQSDLGGDNGCCFDMKGLHNLLERLLWLRCLRH